MFFFQTSHQWNFAIVEFALGEDWVFVFLMHGGGLDQIIYINFFLFQYVESPLDGVIIISKMGRRHFLSSRAGFDIVVVCDFGSFLWYFGYRVGYSLPSCIKHKLFHKLLFRIYGSFQRVSHNYLDWAKYQNRHSSKSI